MMSITMMNEACNTAELGILDEEWAHDWLTRGTWMINRAITAVLNVLLIIPDVVISIPRAILASIPIVNIPYLLVTQAVYMLLFGPALGTSWAWREVPQLLRPATRPVLAVIGVPLALIGTVYCSVFLPGGPGEHGANKYYKKALFESWPLTVDMASRVLQFYPYEL